MDTIIINNTGADISFVEQYFFDFAETGVLHEDVADTFEVEKIVINKQVRIIVKFLT